MKKRILILLAFFLFNSVALKAQTKNELEEEAYNYLNARDFANAYILFDKLNAKYPKEFDYKFKLGLVCLNNPEKKERAIEIFKNIKTETKTPEADYYLGKAYHINYKFDEAVALLQQYIAKRGSSLKKEDKELTAEAKLVINNCTNGKLLIANKVLANIRNIKGPVNSEELEGVPVISTDESILIFTYSGKKSKGGKLDESLKPDIKSGEYREDIFMSTRGADSAWNDPKPINSINTLGNDAAVALSPDGQTLFLFISNNDAGDLYISNLVGNEWTKPVKLNSNINTDAWEGSCSVSADGKFLYFASERAGGLGGRDIYVSEKVNGDWGPAKNMGPNINTAYDDDAPFIHPDGITMFFSSKGHMSIGGYDIMFSLKKENEWLAPRSMGLPLNTTEDDRYYVIDSKGEKGYFSSNRSGSGGFGNQDIYVVQPGILGEKPVIAMLKGIVYGDDKPVEAKIEIIKTINADQFSKSELEEMASNGLTPGGKLTVATYSSNSVSGKYLTTLTPGSIYRIRVTAPNFETLEEDIDIENLNKYMEVMKDFYLLSPSAIAKNTPTTIAETPTNSMKTNTATVITNTTIANNEVKSSNNSALPCNSGALPDFSQLKGKSLNDRAVYQQLLNTAGNYCATNLIFKVQIAAYRKPDNYKYGHLSDYGQPVVVSYPDGITRFTQKEFTTLNDAEKHRQKTITKGQKDAWVVAFIDGKRYTLEELIMLDFLGKSIN
jgi:hypothetical protein